MQPFVESNIIDRLPAAGDRLLITNKEHSYLYEDRYYRIYWEGLVFIHSIPSGEESIIAFTKAISGNGIQDACHLLRGVFFVLVEIKSTSDLYAFVDNSGLYQAFYTSDSLSTSFLALVKKNNLAVSNLVPAAVVEFLRLGSIFSGKTFFEEIRKFSWNAIYHFSGKDFNLRILLKNISDMTTVLDVKNNDFEKVFEGLAVSLSNCNLSIDLTGGNDSRLLAVLMDFHGLKFEAAISGGTAQYEDISVAEKVAESLGQSLFCTIHSVSSLEEDLPKLFDMTDGLYDILYYHRLFQLQNDRKKRGIDTMISGAGGELFKDYWWLQDFPFYSKRHANIERLVDMRIITSKSIDNILTSNYLKASTELRSSVLRTLSRYKLDSNTKTYDSIYYHYLMTEVAGRILTAHSSMLKCYAPFLDPDIARIGFNLPRPKRFFNFYHRKLLTKFNPDISLLPTTEGGMTACARPSAIASDLPKYALDKMKRLFIKIGIKEMPVSSRNNSNFKPMVRKMRIMKDSLDILKEVKVINTDISLDHIEDSTLGMVLSLGMFANFLESND